MSGAKPKSVFDRASGQITRTHTQSKSWKRPFISTHPPIASPFYHSQALTDLIPPFWFRSARPCGFRCGRHEGLSTLPYAPTTPSWPKQP